MRHLIRQPELLSGGFEDAQPFGDDFVADAIALYDSDFESGHSDDSISSYAAVSYHEPKSIQTTKVTTNTKIVMGFRTFVLFVSFVVINAFVPSGALAQAPANMPPYTPPKLANGQPDISGIWQVLNTAAWDLQDHGASLGVPAGRGVVVDNEIPYKPEALAKKRENEAKRATLDPESKCYLSGVPRITFMPFPFQIVQQADKVNILYEYNHTIRQIYMNGNPHPPGHIDWWMGDSRGRWEGNTLVVVVVDFGEETWLDRAGNYHSDSLHGVERYTPISPYHLRYDVTIEDPKVFSRPWNISAILYRRIDPHVELLEYECYAYQLENEFTKK
jgi:hypothetical protein